MRKLTVDEINERPAPRGIRLVGEYQRNIIDAEFYAEECGHSWITKPMHVLKGSGCTECDVTKKLTPEKINQRLAGCGIRLVGEYKGNKKNSKFYAEECGHTFMALFTNIMKRKRCATCNKKDPLTPEMIAAKLSPRGIKLVTPYVKSTKKVTLQADCGHPPWEALLDSVMNGGRGCPHCSKYRKKDKEEVNSVLAPRGIRMISDYPGTKGKATFEADCGHTWKAKPSDVKGGTGCSICSGNLPRTIDGINEQILERGIRLIGELKGVDWDANWEADCGHTWIAKPNKILSGTGCPSCANSGGFDQTKSGSLYYLQIDGPVCTVFKIGITNHSVEQRYKAWEREMITILDERHYEVGKGAKDAETVILSEYKHFKYDGPDILASGHSEMFVENILPNGFS